MDTSLQRSPLSSSGQSMITWIGSAVHAKPEKIHRLMRTIMSVEQLSKRSRRLPGGGRSSLYGQFNCADAEPAYRNYRGLPPPDAPSRKSPAASPTPSGLNDAYRVDLEGDWDVDGNDGCTVASCWRRELWSKFIRYRLQLYDRGEFETPSCFDCLLVWLIVGMHSNGPLFATASNSLASSSVSKLRSSNTMLEQQSQSEEQRSNVCESELLGRLSITDVRAHKATASAEASIKRWSVLKREVTSLRGHLSSVILTPWSALNRDLSLSVRGWGLLTTSLASRVPRY